MSGCEASAASSCFFGARTFLASLVASVVFKDSWYINEEMIAGQSTDRMSGKHVWVSEIVSTTKANGATYRR